MIFFSLRFVTVRIEEKVRYFNDRIIISLSKLIISEWDWIIVEVV